MIPHGGAELRRLADGCDVLGELDAQGWHIDAWQMEDRDVDAAVAVYDAVLAGGMTARAADALLSAGIDVEAILEEDESRDDITRSDVAEFTAAASLVADPGCTTDTMHMPNVPKMSRRKSDSGIDIFEVILSRTAQDDELLEDESLTVASVKHTLDTSTSTLRLNLANSLSLSRVYLYEQLRVINGKLRQEGYSEDAAARLYYFLREFPDADRVALYAVAVVDPGLENDLRHHITLLPEITRDNTTFRMIFMPGLVDVHLRCA